MTLEEARQHIGRGVVYNPRPGNYGSTEDGEIVRVNARYVFVLYVGDRYPQATHARDIRLRGALQ